MRCQMCDADLDAPEARFLGINRIAIGKDDHMRLFEAKGSNGYEWEPMRCKASGIPLCWPHCAMTWLEGMVLEYLHDRKKAHG